MKPLITVLLVCFAAHCLAQKKYSKEIRLDTVHIRGYVYDESGRPVKQLHIWSKTQDYHVMDYRLTINSVTDTAGYFELKGISPNDTLSFSRDDLRFKPQLVYLKGSRFLVINLTHAPANSISGDSTLAITAVRRHSKVIPTLKTDTFGCCLDIFNYYIKPEPIGGMARFLSQLKPKLIYPQKAIEHNIEGSVEVGFDVERDGSLVRFKIIRGIGYGCDEALISALKQMPKWRPGANDARPVVMPQTISVDFKLTDK